MGTEKQHKHIVRGLSMQEGQQQAHARVVELFGDMAERMAFGEEATIHVCLGRLGRDFTNAISFMFLPPGHACPLCGVEVEID